MKLSARERQVVDLAGQGLADKEIAIHMRIKESTVQTYWDRIRRKGDFPNRVSVVASVLNEEIARLRRENEELRRRSLPQPNGDMRPS